MYAVTTRTYHLENPAFLLNKNENLKNNKEGKSLLDKNKFKCNVINTSQGEFIGTGLQKAKKVWKKINRMLKTVIESFVHHLAIDSYQDPIHILCIEK